MDNRVICTWKKDGKNKVIFLKIYDLKLIECSKGTDVNENKASLSYCCSTEVLS